MTSPPDLLAIGRLGVDIYPQQIGVGIEDVDTFGKYVGGSAANVAIAGARHGLASALVSRTGDDPFGFYLTRELEREYRVDTRFIRRDPDLLTPVTFCAIRPPEDFPLYFYRRPTAPDLQITAAEILEAPLADAVRQARIFWFTGTGLSQEPSRSAHQVALRLRSTAAAALPSGADGDTPRLTVFDLDYRETFWPSREQASQAISGALEFADVAVGNQTECAVAVGEGTPDQQADRLLEAGVKLAVVKMGSQGVLGATASKRVRCPQIAVEVVNGLGAGDSFGGALCRGLLAGWPLEAVLNFANAAGALVASRIACSAAMPVEAEVRELLARAGRPQPPTQDRSPR
ncbi:MAG: 5-dehydro-2-deoxygluconokinase [Propionibacteriaceae bacterium]|jgi:5-dehydro-2-deoxygluconokinase|nr:5-dehydro-2-deoxygluconokinase [Propionibacteriaceae bacterium]